MTKTNRTLLLVEDNEDDVFLMQQALRAVGVVNPLFVVQDGQKAVDFLGGAGKFANRDAYPLPAAVFLDLKLPFLSGHDVLAWIRRQKDLESLAVIVLTSSDETSDLSRCYALGAKYFLLKPPTPEELVDVANTLKWSWLKYDD